MIVLVDFVELPNLATTETKAIARATIVSVNKHHAALMLDLRCLFGEKKFCATTVKFRF